MNSLSWVAAGAAVLLAAAGLGAQSAGEIRGYAWDAEGRPIPQATVNVHSDSPKTDRTITAGADGSFDVKELPPGHYEIGGQSQPRQLASESPVAVELKSGETAHADLTLGRSTVHYSFWKRLARRLDGLPH
jgi:hypothetical protein